MFFYYIFQIKLNCKFNICNFPFSIAEEYSVVEKTLCQVKIDRGFLRELLIIPKLK